MKHHRYHGPWRRYAFARAAHMRLHRRLFLWFGAAIVATGLTFVLVMRAMDAWGAGSFQDTARGAGELLASDAAARWTSPGDRAAWAREVSGKLHLALVLKGPGGEVVGVFGRPGRHPITVARVMRPEGAVGELWLYREPGGPHRGWPMGLSLFAASLVLWAIAGKVSRWMTRPFAELSRVAQDLGKGRLSSRMRLSRHQGFEAGILAHALNDMAGRIERQLKDQRELLAAVSHELRTPLSRIRILVELLRSGGASERSLDELDREVMEMDGLVGELLASSRLDFAALSHTSLSAADVAGRALERAGLAPALLRLESPLARLEGDATLLSRALANLLNNAAAHGGGVVSLAVSEREGRVRFAVEDDGPGFTPGQEAGLFTPFQRAHGQGDRPGLGLGLALVRRIAEAHGGTTFAENRPGGGARVGFEVPGSRGGPP